MPPCAESHFWLILSNRPRKVIKPIYAYLEAADHILRHDRAPQPKVGYPLNKNAVASNTTFRWYIGHVSLK